MKLRGLALSVCLLFALCVSTAPLSAQPGFHHQPKVVGGYFQEWSIYAANYNVAISKTTV